MATLEESLKTVTQEDIIDDQKKEFAAAKPNIEMFHHFAATQAAQNVIVITLLDGSFYKAEGLDFMFTDGLSIVHDGHRMYIPKTAIKSILVLNPMANIAQD